MKIGEKAAEAMNKISADLVYANLEEMNRAYLECDEQFTVNVKHKFSPTASGIRMETEMSFNRAGKHRDVMEVIVNDEQQSLFDQADITFESGESAVTITGEQLEKLARARGSKAA